MLSEKVLSFETSGDVVLPRFLSDVDEAWVRPLLEAAQTQEGKAEEPASAAMDGAVRALAKLHSVPREAVSGMRAVVKRSFPSRTRAIVVPRDARRALFEAAARLGPSRLHEAVAVAAAAMKCDHDAVVESAYADFPGARVVTSPATLPTPRQLIDRYNLALVQGMLLRSRRVTVKVRESVRAVVRFAKSKRLLCLCLPDEEDMRIELSGPLSLFHETTRYGFALASFVPAVIATPGWTLEADLVLREKPGVLRLDASAPLPRTHVPPRDDTDVERALRRALRKLGSSWHLAPQPRAYETSDGIAFPDFVLTDGSRSVLVEVLGYWTAPYLARKLAQLRSLRGPPVILCVDTTLAKGEVGSAHERVLQFRKRIDPTALVAMAEQICLGTISRSRDALAEHPI